MKILLISPKSEFPTVGLAYISAAMKQAGHEVECIPHGDLETLQRVLPTKKFDFVATGGISLYLKFFREAILIAKKNKVPTILGGGVVSSDPELIVPTLKPDFAVLGEGEKTIVDLLSNFEKSGDPESVNGIAFLKDGRLIKTPDQTPISDLDSLPYPDWEGTFLSSYLDRAKSSDALGMEFFDYPRTYPLLGARSCPFHCTFCYHPIGQKYRQRSLNSIFGELEIMIPRYKINYLGIFDELFSSSEERILEFCHRFDILRRKFAWDIGWACQIRVDKLSEEMLDAMKKSRCVLASYGFESYSPRVLESMKKHITPAQISRAVEITQKRGMALQAVFIFGDKAENLETANETLDFWKKHKSAGIVLGFLFPLPNSKLFQYCIQKGIIKDRLKYIENHLRDPINVTDLSDWDFARLMTMVELARLKYSRKSTPIEVGKDFVKVVCPYCKKCNDYRNYDITFDNAGLFRIPASTSFFNKMVYCRSCSRRFFMSSKLFRLFSRLVQAFLNPIISFLHIKKTNYELK
ncbi:MAG: cobalamin-dependent protein [Candidatus Riflebacteria bacterium]|nr:cobalamin-dependent protein [Candidatus Riflebacteria bacterium]